MSDNIIVEKFLDVSHPITKSYIDKGFYIDDSGFIYDTTFRPGDTVKVIGSHFTSSIFKRGNKLIIEAIKQHDATPYYGSGGHDRRDLVTYQRRSGPGNNFYATYIRKSVLKFAGSNNKPDAKHFELVNGAFNMTALELKKPTLVRELKENVNSTGTELTEIGEFLPFDSVSAARNYVTAKIREAVRSRNVYPQFRIYTQDSIALAEEPVVTFK